MWAAALKTFEDESTNYLFYPEKVVLTERSKIQKDITKHKLGLQINKHTDIWIKISTTLNKLFNNDPREILKAGNHDVAQILNIIKNTHKSDFPYLRGPKLSNYWLYILDSFTDVKLVNTHKISIIPDTHIIKSSIYLGLVKEKAKIPEIENAWVNLLKGSHLSPVDMHSVLWNWSRNNFKPDI